MNKVLRVSDVDSFLGHRVLWRLRRDCDAEIISVADLNEGRPGSISFARSDSEAVRAAISRTESSLLLIVPDLQSADFAPDTTVLAVADPRREWARITNALLTPPVDPVVDPTGLIDHGAVVGPGTSIGPGVHIESGVTVGRDCRIGTRAVLMSGTTLGDRVVVGPGAVIGGSGFGFAREDDGTPVPVPHRGGVRIGSDVEIGANSCIDRGVFVDTVIDDHVKIDNLVQIGHNCRVGRSSFIIATAVLCGGVEVGQRAWVGPGAVIIEKVSVGDDATVGLGATVVRPVPDGARVMSAPARPVLGS